MKENNCLFFDSHEATAAYLEQNPGNALMTIGSKELHKYTKVTDYQQRLFPRVLPMAEVMEHCSLLGFKGKQLILMQGPFTTELNAAMIRQIHARYLVTKDSGETGGFTEKYQAALQTGTVLLVIGREAEEAGLTPEALGDFLEKTYGITLKGQTEAGQWFPFYTNIREKEFLVIGAGKIAKRRIETLLKFDCRIRVIAPEALTEVKEYHEEKRLELQLRPYEPDDINGADYVLAATNNKEINHEIYLECKKRKIPVNVANCKEKSDFYFPGIIRENGLTVGVTAEGKNHALAKNATQAIGRLLNSVFPGVEQEEIKWNGEK
jgi:precorrin-2 dehydrogenase/sirohydrochlorin ferrochelatase/precorrin-6A/cobalt-precorrin-6A reductase